MKYRLAILVCITATMALLAAACSKDTEFQGTATLKVAAYQKDSFEMEYGNLFAAKFPNIEVEVAQMNGIWGENDDRDAAFQKWADREKPDVLLLDQNQYEKMARQGQLIDLNPLIRESKYNMKSYHEGILNLLKTLGEGTLYGLAPDFNSKALYYNKDLFDRNGVPYPTDRMTWQQLLELSQRFPSGGKEDDRIYGLSLLPWDASPASLMGIMGETEGLSSVSVPDMKVRVNSPEWTKIAEIAVNAFKSGAIQRQDVGLNGVNTTLNEDIWDQNAFLNGKAAMFFADFGMIHQVIAAEQKAAFHWDTVSSPVNPAARDVSKWLVTGSIYAINAKSSNIPAAWEFIKYVNSDETAKLKSKSAFQLRSRTGWSEEMNGHSLKSFYLLNFDLNNSQDISKIPLSFIQHFTGLLNQELQSAIQSDKTVDESLLAVQEQGQTALDDALLKAKNENQ